MGTGIGLEMVEVCSVDWILIEDVIRMSRGNGDLLRRSDTENIQCRGAIGRS